jgi:hypothetical protein
VTGELVLDRIEDEVSAVKGPVNGVRNAISTVALPRRRVTRSATVKFLDVDEGIVAVNLEATFR